MTGRPRPSAPADPGDTSKSRPPAALVVVLALVAVEILALVAWAVWALAALVGGTPNARGAVFLGLFALAVAALLAGALRALVRRRRWGRAPVVTWQLLQAATGAAVVGAGLALGWALVAPAVVTVLLMVSRPVVAHTVPA